MMKMVKAKKSHSEEIHRLMALVSYGEEKVQPSMTPVWSRQLIICDMLALYQRCVQYLRCRNNLVLRLSFYALK